MRQRRRFNSGYFHHGVVEICGLQEKYLERVFITLRKAQKIFRAHAAARHLESGSTNLKEVTNCQGVNGSKERWLVGLLLFMTKHGDFSDRTKGIRNMDRNVSPEITVTRYNIIAVLNLLVLIAGLVALLYRDSTNGIWLSVAGIVAGGMGFTFGKPLRTTQRITLKD